jgi:ATP/maltotriose-dependent transcriptional regulator MalT
MEGMGAEEITSYNKNDPDNAMILAEEITSYNKNDPDNAMILAQENAGNIQVIKKQLEKFLDLDKQVNTMNNDLDKLAVQVNGIIMN